MTIFPLFLLIFGLFLEYSGFDLWWVSHFYNFNHQTWLFRDHWLFDGIIHTGGRNFIKVVAGLWLICFMPYPSVGELMFFYQGADYILRNHMNRWYESIN